jgi:hypothetical protein
MRCDGTECQGPGGLQFTESGAGVQVCFAASPSGTGCLTVGAAQNQWHYVAVRGKNNTNAAGAWSTTGLELFLDGAPAGQFAVPANVNVFTNLPTVYPGQFASPSAVFTDLDELEAYQSYVPNDMICALSMGSWNGATCN